MIKKNLSDDMYYVTKYDKGLVFVMAPHLKGIFFSTLEHSAKGQKIDVISVDDQDWKQSHEELVKGAEKGSIVVMVGEKNFPYRLAHIAYVFNKGDGLVLPDGGTRRNYGSKDFNLVCWMTPQAWGSVNSHLRDDLIRVSMGGVHCYLDSVLHSDHISALEGKRWAARKNPVEALMQAKSFEERHELLLQLFPPNMRTGTFEGYDETLLQIMEDLAEEQSEDGQKDMLEIFAIHNDFYLAGQALKRNWPYRENTLTMLSDEMAKTPHIGGQGQHFWDLMKELAERGQPTIRKLMENLIDGGGLGAENVLFVLTKIRPWPDILKLVARIAKSNNDLQFQDICRKILQNAQSTTVGTKKRSASLLERIFGKSEGDYDEDDYQHYMDVGLKILKAQKKMPLEPGLGKLAMFQARIQRLDVGHYPKSILTFERAVESLVNFPGSWIDALEYNHLASVSSSSNEYRLMRKMIEDMGDLE